MSRQQEIIAALIASELTNQQLALLLELVSVMSTGLSSGSQVESPVDALARRRKYEREYKARRRAAAKYVSTLVSTGLSTGQVDMSTNDEEETSNKEVVERKNTAASVVEGRKQKSARGTRFSADTPLTDEYRNAAIELGMHPDMVAGAWAEFVDYWIAVPGQRGTKLNWLSTWRNRVRQIATRFNSKPQVNHGKRTVQDAAKDLVARVRAFDEPQPVGGLRGGTGGAPLRLLSQG